MTRDVLSFLTMQRPQQSALIVSIPTAEPAVSRHRSRLDLAAADGVPAHATVLFPWVPPEQLGEGDLARLAEACSAIEPFELVAGTLVRFGETTLVLTVQDERPMSSLIRAVASAFPSYPPYEGSIPLERIVPHLTIGRSEAPALLHEVEREIAPHLPIRQAVTEVEIWAGPEVGQRTRPAPWHRIGAVPLGVGTSGSAG